MLDELMESCVSQLVQMVLESHHRSLGGFDDEYHGGARQWTLGSVLNYSRESDDVWL